MRWKCVKEHEARDEKYFTKNESEDKEDFWHFPFKCH